MKTCNERMHSILEKAEMQKLRNARNRKRKIIAIVSSIAAAVIAFNLVLFVPYTVGDVNLSQYRTSEYYGVIQKLSKKTHSPYTTNNFHEWFGDLSFGSKKGASAPGDWATSSVPGDNLTPSAPGSSESNNNYNEVTLNQTKGVTEGDLFKRSDTHIFYLGHNSSYYAAGAQKDAAHVLKVYTLAGMESKEAGSFEIVPDEDMYFANNNDREMYLSKDLSTVTVITQCYEYSSRVTYTAVINVDVTNLSDIKEKGRSYISGAYVSSRVVGEAMLVITNFAVRSNVNYDYVPAFVPHVINDGEKQPLSASDIVCPDQITTTRYTVISSLDGNSEVTDTVALLSYTDDVYVSQNNLFVTRSFDEIVNTENEHGLSYIVNKTEIRVVPYGNGQLGDTRSVSVNGSVLNRYSLDEYDGMLRVVTTVRLYSQSYHFAGEDPYRGMFGNRCCLYCLDMDTLERKAAVLDFAPMGETVRSARFDGNTAYVCTAEEVKPTVVTDPVFMFDLSDLEHITYKDTGTIPGYSLSLNKFAYGTLLGIGYGETMDTLKIELYEQNDSQVVSVAKYEQEGVTFSAEFKAHLIDSDNCLIGLGVQPWNVNSTQYKLFLYDGYDLIELYTVSMDMSHVDSMRATVVDGYVYIFGDEYYNSKVEFKVVKLA